VGRAAWWLGAAWARSLAALGVADARVWTGPMQRSRWSDKICFGGVGPGEVLTPRGKVVGISQRRTRWGVVFQCAALLTWDPGVVPGLLRLPAHERAEAALDLAGAADPVGEGRGADLLAALVAALVT